MVTSSQSKANKIFDISNSYFKLKKEINNKTNRALPRNTANLPMLENVVLNILKNSMY